MSRVDAMVGRALREGMPLGAERPLREAIHWLATRLDSAERKLSGEIPTERPICGARLYRHGDSSARCMRPEAPWSTRFCWQHAKINGEKNPNKREK